jgi:hypothetical protein
MPYREKADFLSEISRELAGFEDPRGEVAGRAGLVESDPAVTPPAPSPSGALAPPKPKLVSQP